MKKKRTFGVLAATFAAAVVPMVAASPASATSADCQVFLRNVGYTVGPRVQGACSTGETGWVGEQGCYALLVQAGVKPSDAREACYQASR
ncbi:hypothetical protein [Streptomyces sp. PvR034]|uniref:hypothetical protein n=1 Tax=Streptomyces sp. PvR034 TaxID=3156401 RepID=UPI0033973BAE